MTGVRQGWLVAVREMRERSRSKAFRVSLLFMILAVVAFIVLPATLDAGDDTRSIGLTGAVPAGLTETIEAQGGAVDIDARVRSYDSVAAGEQAVRDGDVDVLVVDGSRLEWRRNRTDDELRAVVAGAIQVVSIRERAEAAGISPDELLAMVAPVPVEDVELGSVAGRSADDETAALVMTLVLFGAISTYGGLVLGGVVEEKSSRVVEVLLARMPARSLLAGKVAGIGLLGLAQVGITAFAAFVAISTVESFDVPAVRGEVLAWCVVWFVLGYALYAMVYGALGSLASRSEDAGNVAGPVMVVMMLAFFGSFAAAGSPDTSWARALSYFPVTAPLAMPTRIAMGVTAWWEPGVAALLTLAAIAGLVLLGGRVYSGAILHTGPTLTLREAWRGSAAPVAAEVPAGRRPSSHWTAVLRGHRPARHP